MKELNERKAQAQREVMLASKRVNAAKVAVREAAQELEDAARAQGRAELALDAITQVQKAARP